MFRRTFGVGGGRRGIRARVLFTITHVCGEVWIVGVGLCGFWKSPTGTLRVRVGGIGAFEKRTFGLRDSVRFGR